MCVGRGFSRIETLKIFVKKNRKFHPLLPPFQFKPQHFIPICKSGHLRVLHANVCGATWFRLSVLHTSTLQISATSVESRIMSHNDTLREPLVLSNDEEDLEFLKKVRSTARLPMMMELVLQPIMYLVGRVNLQGALGVIPYVVQVGAIVVSFLLQFRTLNSTLKKAPLTGMWRRATDALINEKERIASVETRVPRFIANGLMNYSLFLGWNGSVIGCAAVLPSVDTLRRADVDRGLERRTLREGAPRAFRHGAFFAHVALRRPLRTPRFGVFDDDGSCEQTRLEACGSCDAGHGFREHTALLGLVWAGLVRAACQW